MTPAETIPESPRAAKDLGFIDYDSIIIDDGKPVDNFYVESLYRLLTEPLETSWGGPGEGRPFIVAADVGVFNEYGQPPLVPDVFLSLDVSRGNTLEKENRSYFVWVKGKVPDVVIEIVSDRRGGEAGKMLAAYAKIRVPYYVVHDPFNILKKGVLFAFELTGQGYKPIDPKLFPAVGLGLTMWDGAYENQSMTWLRWIDRDGKLIATGAEQAAAATARADAAEARAKRLEAKLRSLGQDLNGDG